MGRLFSWSPNVREPSPALSTRILEDMSVADVVRKAETKLNALTTKRSKSAGWKPKIIGFTGYGNTDRVRILGRVLMQDPHRKIVTKRGFWQFFTVELADFPVTITVGNRTVETTSDSNGYIEALISDHGLEPGWHEVTISSAAGFANDTIDSNSTNTSTTAEVLILDSETKYGIVSDIDDTVIVTMLPRALIAAYNSWFKETDKRTAVAGFSEFYAELRRRYTQPTQSARSAQPSQTQAGQPTQPPVIYLSTGAWNTFGTLKRFLHRNNLPKGPLLLTDWGPTPTGLFRSGQEHKKVQLRNLFIDFPDIKWILVGDDGQHDPLIYGEAAAEHPDKVAAIAIRNLTPSEHVLSHGTAVPIEKLETKHVPFIEGADGFELLTQIDQLP